MIENTLPNSAPALINAYLDGNLSLTKREEVESLIATNEMAGELFRSKSEAKERLRELIPNKKLSKESLDLIKSELRDSAKDLFPEEKKSLGKKLADILDTTIFEF